MIFCGDIALPLKNGLRILEVPNTIRQQFWVGNLEGSLIKGEQTKDLLREKKVFNHYDAISDLFSILKISCLGIANNHLKDAAPVRTTLDNIKTMGVPCIGAGQNNEEARIEICIGNYVLIAFGWEGISCNPSTKSREGVNSYEKDEVLSQTEVLLSKYPGKRIIPFMHWNYELELYPQPLDRELAHRLIDMGVYAVIGCHAHRVQPIEIYKGHPIVYGLGNFAFMQGVYMNGKLKFPEFSYQEIVFEISDEGQFRVHHFLYDPQRQALSYQRSSDVENASFADLSSDEYKRFFKANRIQKIFLPIFYFEDSKITYNSKIKIVKFRQELIKCIIGNKKVFNAIKRVMLKLS